MKIKRRFNLIIAVLFAALIVFSSFPISLNLPHRSYAAENVKFDNTDIMDDLKQMQIDGKPFDVLDYPDKPLADNLEIINVVEYCYTYIANMRDNYGVYLYIYNPARKDIVTDSELNKVQLAVGYDKDRLPNDYAKFGLKFCGKSTGIYEGLYLKYKVIDEKGADGKYIVERVNSNGRRYDISGFELLTKGGTTATEYGFGGTYIFSGYAKGYGATEESTITVDLSKKLETVELEVNHTNYRTGEVSKYHQNELNTAYFGVPQRLFDEYGDLQKIKAEWYEYRTSPIFVTEDEGGYDYLKDYVGVNIDKNNDSVKWAVYIGLDRASRIIEYAYNQYPSYASPLTLTNDYIKQINWLFSTGEESYKDYSVSRKEVTDWIITQSEKFADRDKVQGKYWADLFADSIDQNRLQYLSNPEDKRGYIVREFDAGEELKLLSYSDTHNGWQRFWDYFGRWHVKTDGGANYSPIEILDGFDETLGKSAYCKKNLINEADYSEYSENVKKVFAKDGDEKQRLVLFRFAATDYTCIPARFDYLPNNSGFGGLSDEDGYMAQQTCFLDFDIIQLTFSRDNNVAVIPVVSSPIDIFNGVTPTPTDKGCNGLSWKIILALICIVLLLIILAPVLPYIIQAVFWIILLPFKAISGIVKACKRKKE